MEKINYDKAISELKKELSKNIFRASEHNSNSILKKLNKTYMDLTLNLGSSWHPYINGRYMTFMTHGTWIDEVVSQYDTKKADLSIMPDNVYSFLKEIKNNSNKSSKFNNLFPTIATDVDLPQINNEFLNVSNRNQGITYFSKQTFLPDFSISYIEDQNNLSIIQYHDAWFRAMELYRRGIFKLNKSVKKRNYFYEVPYLNGVWVVIFDIRNQIRGLIYLVGIKPVNHPLKNFLGNRSSSKMTVYNIQYKTTNMYYNFFKNTEDFMNQLDNQNKNKNILLSHFNSCMLKLN